MAENKQDGAGGPTLDEVRQNVVKPKGGRDFLMTCRKFKTDVPVESWNERLVRNWFREDVRIEEEEKLAKLEGKNGAWLH